MSYDCAPKGACSGEPYVGTSPPETDAVIDVERAYVEFAPAVLGYLRSNAVASPEDLLGEIFLQVVRDVHRFRGSETAFRRWVFTIAHNRLMDHFRRARRSPSTTDLSSAADAADPRELDAYLPDAELLAALGELTPEQRQVVVLRFVADLSIDDVAQIMRRRAGAVKALQQRALTNLSSRLGSPP
jgi:RNA polymerase sigma-70 factor (ECF subfamily)